MGLGIAVLCLVCWLIGVDYGAYLRERHTTNRSLREIVGSES